MMRRALSNRMYRLRRSAAARGIRAAAPAIRRFRSDSTQYHFDAKSYVADVSLNVPRYRELQLAVARATSDLPARSALDLGVGTGETAAAVLEIHPELRITGVDASKEMLDVARERLPARSVENLVLGRLEEPLPNGRFDLVTSALAVHHLKPTDKRKLFLAVRRALSPQGRFVLGDVVQAEKPEDAVSPISRVYDRPERLAKLERWLVDAGFDVKREWSRQDLAVLVAEPPKDRQAS